MNKWLAVVALVWVLTGCAGTKYKDLDWGEATLSNIQVKETHYQDQGVHHFDVSFDYRIDGFHAVDGLYDCSLYFFTTNGGYKALGTGSHECVIDQAEGSINMRWKGPLDYRFYRIQNFTANIMIPVQYFLAINQKVARKHNQIIGHSDIMKGDVTLDQIKMKSR